ncbi:biopolymer transporter ExbD [Salinisphaera sp. T31B1]|uniref:ExbD/TolR family protein n=1 Tax=Salinisphaera sp. T31B1 TaxID=727963 RepID=UPI00333F2812
MKFTRPNDVEPTINITPLIDVVFILLIFFMVSARFVDEHDLALDLPAADAATATPSARALIVAVAADGGYRVDGARVSGPALAASLAKLRTRYPHRPLRLRADGDARHAAVVHAMDAASAAGFARVDIATRTH